MAPSRGNVCFRALASSSLKKMVPCTLARVSHPPERIRIVLLGGRASVEDDAAAMPLTAERYVEGPSVGYVRRRHTR